MSQWVVVLKIQQGQLRVDIYILQLMICYIKLSGTKNRIQNKSLPITATINNNNVNISQSTQDRMKSKLPVQ